VLDLTTDQLVRTDDGLALVRQLMEEVRAAARADGVELPAELVDLNINNTLSMGPYKSSMQVDRQQGRPMEVEAILREPLRRARAGGANTPVLEALYRAARVVDAGIRIRGGAELAPA
jgi:ketopantoate reductase